LPVADYGLTDTLLDDPESADFLNKFVGAHNTHPIVDPSFRFPTMNGGPPAQPAAADDDDEGGIGAIPPPLQQLPAQRKPSPTQRSTRVQHGQHPTPMSPLGGSRLGKRKSTPTKKVGSLRGDGGSRAPESRSPATEKEAKGKGKEADKQAIIDEIAEYLKKPDDFEDLINECVGGQRMT
jgi:hypothetical protein